MTVQRRETQSDQADRILVDALVWTGVPGAPARAGWGVAVAGGRIVAVGPSADLLALRGPHTAVRPLGGRTILPGFVDSHVHLLTGGLDLFRVELRGIQTVEELAHRVGDRARITPPGEWIRGGGWDENEWGGPLPHRTLLDRVASDHPVLLLRNDLHMGVANSEALRRAGIASDTPEPAHGRIDRTEDREPTGILREGALEIMARVMPPPSAAERAAALRAATHHALSLGVTQVHDMGALQSAEESWASLDGLRALRREGRLPIRVYAQVPISERAEMARWIEAEGRGDEQLRWGGVKGFVDGSLGTATAWMHEPYHHDHRVTGAPASDPEELRAGILEAAEMGLQPINHAIGDRAADWLIGVYEEVVRRHPEKDLRPRIEHAQHLSEEGIGRIGAGKMHVSMQPAQMIADGPWAGERIGPERMRRAFAFRSLLDAGATVSFGSDWTVAPMDPRLAIDAAVNRIDREGTAFGPGQAIELAESLRAHGAGGAHAGFWEGTTGTLEPGKWADLVVMDPSPFDVSEDGGSFAQGTEVAMTFVGGALMWRRDDVPAEADHYPDPEADR